MWTAMTSPMVSTLPLHAPLSVLISTTSTTLHSSEAGLSATRGADTRQAFRHREAGMSELVVAARERRRGRVHRIAQFARRQIGDELAALPGECDRVLPALAGEADNRRNAAKTIEKTVGARLTRPSSARVEIQPIGRGATIALNGSCGSLVLSRLPVS